MGLHDAVYLAATDKIYGVMSNYILKFNATTGAKEASAKVCSPMYGPMRIAGRASVLYVASAQDYSVNEWYDTPATASNREIWSVDATTLVATNPLGVDAKILAAYPAPNYSFFASGPRALQIVGDYLYFYWTYDTAIHIYRINVTNPADYAINNNVQTSYQLSEQFDVDATSVWRPNPNGHFVGKYDADLLNAVNTGYIDTTAAHHVVSVRIVPLSGKSYALTGTENLLRLDDYVAHTFTALNLGAVYANVKPMRMRLDTTGTKLYIPCQNQDVVIIWDTVTDTGTYKDGFASPIDVVFTASKIWAVQSGIQSLKEII